MTDNDHSYDDISALLRIGLDEGLDETRRVRRSSSWDPPSVEELQQALPQYEITAFIARGGMGAVYKGTQKALGRTVAIKVLPRGLEDVDGRFAARFKGEAQAMARLSHPNIVTVYEAGETRSGDIPAATPGETGDRNVAAPWAAGGMLYFVMEFIDGTDVAKLIASEGFVGPQRAMEITTAVCEALAFAHEAGIIHRDIKPSNILLDRKGRVKVADFGLARMTDPGHAMRSVAETMIGTPDFMAPEALIQGMRVDERADIYAVGVMLYQMLTGSVPRGRFAPPSGLRPGVDRALDAVVDKALQTNREQRYSTASEMKTAIDKVAPSMNSRRIADTQGTESMKRDGRMRVAALIVTIAVSVGLLAAGVFIVMKKRTKWSAQSPVRQVAVDATGTTEQGTVRTTSAATKEAPFVNSLGMKFVPVPILGGPTGVQRVLFSVWDTRVQDYEVFIEETKREWPTAEFPQEPTHPAIHVSWDDAQLFCQWLTARDQAAGKLGANERYRLPSDHEWSCAVGIGAREDAAKLPSAKDGLITDVYPWGTEWPPPKGAGNYGGEESQPDPSADGKRPAELVALGYNDGFVNTSPAGSFAANRFGLHDLGGNVRQWCEDWFDQHQKARVLRGASWNGRRPSLLLSSRRSPNEPGLGGHLNGFRCVLAGSAAPGTAAPSQ